MNYKYTSKEIRDKFLNFMKSKGHAILPSASLVPKEDPTVLFTTAGMQPLVPYLLGQPHPQGGMLANSQKCVRTVDIEEVGDNRHLSFFEMLGNWSIGTYFKKEAIEWSFEFLTNQETGLGINPKRLYVTTYKGGKEAPLDQEAVEQWKKEFAKVGLDPEVGMEYDFKNQTGGKYRYRVTQMNAKENWWGLPHRGPCGGDTEIFYLLDQYPEDYIEKVVSGMDPQDAENFLENNLVEIWNNVFMEYEGEWGDVNGQKEPINLIPLKNKNVDTGMGLERIVTVLNGLDTVYQSDMLAPLVDKINTFKSK